MYHLFDLINRCSENSHLVLGCNQWVKYPGFQELYVRISPRYYDNLKVLCLDLTNIRAKNPGQGAFKRLIQEVQETYPLIFIYVENVFTKRFEEGLLRMGFERDLRSRDRVSSFWLVPETYRKLAGATKSLLTPGP